MRYVLAFVALLLASPVHAQANGRDPVPQELKESAYKISTEMAVCSGFYDALGILLKDEDPVQAKWFREMGNGAYTASAMAASGAIEAKLAWEFARGKRETERTFWILHIRNMEKGDRKFSERERFCIDLNPIQVLLVDEARKQAYGFKEKPKR